MRTFFSRLLDLVLYGRREDRLSQEVQAHLDLLTDEHIARGLSPADARLAARKTFGGVDQVKIRYREQRGLPILDAWLQDARFAVRLLTRDRGFALTAIVVLAVGIGVNNIFFTVLYAFKFRGLPIGNPDRILSISAYDDRAPQRAISLNEFQEMRDALTTLDVLAAHTSAPVTVGDPGRAPDRFAGAYITAGAFESLGVAPLMGALPAADHDRAGAPPVVALGAGAWSARYNNDPGILGRTILIDGLPATVVAIMPERSGFPNAAGVWLPLGQWPGMQQSRDARALQLFGRLRDTATQSDARSEIEALFGRLEAARPDTNRNVRARVLPINVRLLGTLDGWEPFIMAGIIVVLVACANVANLTMARAVHRSPEIALRTSLGASRARIVRQLLVEAAVLAAVGGALGGVISVAGVAAFESVIPEGTLPYWMDSYMDGGVFLALLAMSLITVVVFGLVPALHASQTDVNRVLKAGGRSATGGRPRVWTAAFLTAQLALAMIMLTQVAIVTLRSNSDLPTDPAIRTTAVMTTAVTLPPAAYPTAERRNDFFRRVNERLAARNEIAAVSRANILPGEGVSGMRRVDVEGRAAAEGAEAPVYLVIDIAPSYLATLGLASIVGRDFNDGDGLPGNETALVNDRFVEVAMGGASPIGARVAVAPPAASRDTPSQFRTIVGVIPTIRQQGAGGVDQPVVYLPIAAASPATSMLIARHTVDPEGAARLLRAEVQAVDPNVPLFRMRTLERAVADAQWNGTLSAYLAGTVCVLCVLLAIVGLYAVTAHRVALKTQEIGLRMALGARSLQVVRLVLSGLRVPLLLGLVLGTIGAVAWDRAFSSGSRDLYASAPETVMTIGGLLIAIVAVSCLIPLRRAVRMNPVTALRHE
jgi:putative ABC transport system permease protein